jgi:class 3 adenylate cyclase
MTDGVRYVQAEGHHLAYRVHPGAAGRDIVLITPGGTIPMDFLVQDRIGRRLVDGLAELGRVILFDRRGIGTSDPVLDWSTPLVAQWAEDLAAIVDANCDGPTVVVSLGDYWGPARLFAAARPDALEALVLYEPTGPEDPSARASLTDVPIGEDDPSVDWIAHVCPSRAHDRTFREWFDRAGRTGASPGVARRIYERPPAEWITRLGDAQRDISAPTVVLRRPGNHVGSPAEPDPVAGAIPGAERVDLPGHDYHWLGEDVDDLLGAVARFVTGERRVAKQSRNLGAVLFTDLVGSTGEAVRHGDARWRDLLDRHDDAIRDEIVRFGGTVVKTTGDGVLAIVPSADRALSAAAAIRNRLAGEGLDVRIGVHVGDVERRDDDVSGIAIHVAARVMGRAGAGEILATESVVIAVLGTDHQLVALDDVELRGVPGRWTLYRADDAG